MRIDILLLVVRSLRGVGGCRLLGGPLDDPRTPKSIVSARRRGAHRDMWNLIDPYSMTTRSITQAEGPC